MTWPSFSCPKCSLIPELPDHLPYKTSSAGLQFCWIYHSSFLVSLPVRHNTPILPRDSRCGTPVLSSPRISLTLVFPNFGEVHIWICFPFLTHFYNAAMPGTSDRQPWTLSEFRRWIMVASSTYLIIFWITTKPKVFSKVMNKLEGNPLRVPEVLCDCWGLQLFSAFTFQMCKVANGVSASGIQRDGFSVH